MRKPFLYTLFLPSILVSSLFASEISTTYTPTVRNLPYNSLTSAGASGKFTTICTGLPKHRYTTTKVNRSELALSLQQLRCNIANERKCLAKLEALLRQPELSAASQVLLGEIELKMDLIEFYKECIVSTIYPYRSFESLMQEAQRNCLGPVELILDKNGCFFVPKLVKSKSK